MEDSTQAFAWSLLSAVSRKLPADFAGLGVVFYEQLDALPFLGLHVPSDADIPVPATGLAQAAEVLSRISSLSSGWHDGFHFVDVKHQALTHLSQFLSPPLPAAPLDGPAVGGARHMTAVLASRVPGIWGVGILTHRNEIVFFRHGHQTPGGIIP
ncbi:hypothetical protein [Pseudoxanthomonas sp.]|uniref:hypothetical protein n=1 Tax=Pseudoxanthomonas sp. TaxID=1871049 RepID=UPI002FE34B67